MKHRRSPRLMSFDRRIFLEECQTKTSRRGTDWPARGRRCARLCFFIMLRAEGVVEKAGWCWSVNIERHFTMFFLSANLTFPTSKPFLFFRNPRGDTSVAFHSPKPLSPNALPCVLLGSSAASTTRNEQPWSRPPSVWRLGHKLQGVGRVRHRGWVVLPPAPLSRYCESWSLPALPVVVAARDCHIVRLCCMLARV